MTRDEWRNYICCVLTVREELIATNRPLVQDLVNHVLGAGAWLDQQQANRDKAVQIAAGRKFFNQDPNIIRFVMENPDRPRDLRRPAHDPRRVRGADAAVGRGRHAQAPGRLRDLRGRELRTRAKPPGIELCAMTFLILRALRCCAMRALLAARPAFAPPRAGQR
jgi:ABC-type nitrate/sulfonate/bicarbonate transport system substrate-binding protein